MTHPLTDEIISKQFGILDVFNNEMDYDEDNDRLLELINSMEDN